jgi:hypothetical protein
MGVISCPVMFRYMSRTERSTGITALLKSVQMAIKRGSRMALSIGREDLPFAILMGPSNIGRTENSYGG